MHISLHCFTGYTRDGFGFAATGKLKREGLGDWTLLPGGILDRVMHCYSGVGRKDKKKTVCLFNKYGLSCCHLCFLFCLFFFVVNFWNVVARKWWHLLWGPVETQHSICWPRHCAGALTWRDIFTSLCTCKSIIKECPAMNCTCFCNEMWCWSEEGMSKNKLSQENKMHF